MLSFCFLLRYHTRWPLSLSIMSVLGSAEIGTGIGMVTTCGIFAFAGTDISVFLVEFASSTSSSIPTYNKNIHKMQDRPVILSFFFAGPLLLLESVPDEADETNEGIVRLDMLKMFLKSIRYIINSLLSVRLTNNFTKQKCDQ